MIKHYICNRCKQIIKREKVTRAAEAESLAKECRRHQVLLQKQTVLGEDDPESLAIKETNKDYVKLDVDQNWPPARPHKKCHVVSPALDSDPQMSEDD